MNYRNQLISKCKHFNLSQGETDYLAGKFDYHAQKHGDEATYNHFNRNWSLIMNHAQGVAAIQYRLPQTETGKQIESALDEASTQKILSDPVTRCKRAIVNFRKNISKVSGATLTSAFTGGHSIDILSSDEIEGLAKFQDEMDFGKGNELTRWNAYASEHGLKD